MGLISLKENEHPQERGSLQAVASLGCLIVHLHLELSLELLCRAASGVCDLLLSTLSDNKSSYFF